MTTSGAGCPTPVASPSRCSNRLHSLAKPTSVSWMAVHGQFGAGFRLVRQIKPTFIEALNMALAVYPEARVNADKQGFILHPSPPAVPKTES